MIVTKPSGTSSTIFFGVKDGLKYKEIAESPQGTISTSFSDYSEVKGINFPMSMKQVMGPQSFDITVKSIEINSGIDDSKFAINE
jgi:hypothetical protein